MIPPQSLKYFAEVARSGSLRLASEAFFVAPSAIGKQIANLEKEFGAQLFERSPRGMVLTAAGKIFLEFVLDGEHRANAVRANIDELADLQHGHVNLAIIEAAAESFVPELLADFSRRFPKIQFEIRLGGTAQIVESVASHDADIGLAFNVLNRDDVRLLGRIAQPLQVIFRSGHPLAGLESVNLEQLASFQVALPDKTYGIRYLIDQAAEAEDISLNICYQVNSLQAIKALVRRTDAVGFMPAMTFVHELELGWLDCIPFQNVAAQAATIDVVTARVRTLPAAAAEFLKTLLERVRNTP